MKTGDRLLGDRLADDKRVAFPHIFNVAGQHLERGLNLVDAMDSMERELEPRSELGQVYAMYCEAVLHESGSMHDYRMFRVGFALTVAAIRGALAERGEPMPVVPGDEFSIYRHAKFASWQQNDSAQYDLKLALLRDEQQLVEAVDAASSIDPEDSDSGGDYVALFNGSVAAYLTFSSAEALARCQRLDNEAAGFVGQLAAVDVLR